MTRRSPLPFLALALAPVWAACVTETGNPELDVQLRASATSSTARVAVSAPALTVDAAWVVIDDVRLVEGELCDAAGEVEHTAVGPFETDLLAASPAAITIPAQATDYCRLRVRLDKADGVDAAPAGLDDHSVYLAGSRADGARFEIRSRSGFEVDLRSRGEPFPLAEGADQLLLAFDLGAWLAPVDLEGATPEDGVIRVDEDHERDLLDAFEAGVEAAMELYSDGGDGRLDDDDALLAD